MTQVRLFSSWNNDAGVQAPAPTFFSLPLLFFSEEAVLPFMGPALNNDSNSDSICAMLGASPCASLTKPVMERTSSRKNSCTGKVRPGMFISTGMVAASSPQSSSSKDLLYSDSSLSLISPSSRFSRCCSKSSSSFSLCRCTRLLPTPHQYSARSLVGIVALMRISCRSSRSSSRSCSAIIRNSVFLSRSWISSMIKWVYSDSLLPVQLSPLGPSTSPNNDPFPSSGCNRFISTPGVQNNNCVFFEEQLSRRTE
mmetsp:Transcript_37614/g.80256  ORF Transcript_37614/g.80256 Transcript_37614/m.80256 type:complete len:254 (-) Transcript_37614:1342-2103(-)